MPAFPPFFRQVVLIALGHAKFLWSLPRSWALLGLMLVVCLGIGHCGVETVERWGALSSSGEMFLDAGPKALPGVDIQWAKYLLVTRPAVVSLFGFVFLYCTTFFVTLWASDTFASDIGGRTLRYLLLRTSRQKLYVGRLMGTSIFSVVSIAIVCLATLIFIYVRTFGTYPVGEYVAWSLWCTFACVWFALCITSASVSVSVYVTTPMRALQFSWIVLFGLPIVILLVKYFWPIAAYAQYIVPDNYKLWALKQDVHSVLLGIVALLGLSCVFSVAGYRKFIARDL